VNIWLYLGGPQTPLCQIKVVIQIIFIWVSSMAFCGF